MNAEDGLDLGGVGRWRAQGCVIRDNTGRYAKRRVFLITLAFNKVRSWAQVAAASGPDPHHHSLN
ncbi:hypothetical protein IWW34DRAFT_640335 [Fusarium oxysporum f. sp. albedinis]|uniref:Uncharacterized protein n=1 Tax=Fusarium oxysporum (strain Fo5176) TaxID=660025 RepID=F9GAW5_FUSOF|nr:hypothetical protein FOXB_15797 [Fusarium oxysporum f. sp. conglutinans Fo5176]KAI3570869.1 hypothetical protein IWW34DRAFT_640335 [Fusarium oxysporum f. sp. albedinis]